MKEKKPVHFFTIELFNNGNTSSIDRRLLHSLLGHLIGTDLIIKISFVICSHSRNAQIFLRSSYLTGTILTNALEKERNEEQCSKKISLSLSHAHLPLDKIDNDMIRLHRHCFDHQYHYNILNIEINVHHIISLVLQPFFFIYISKK